jgi:hypothetical protein
MKKHTAGNAMLDEIKYAAMTPTLRARNHKTMKRIVLGDYVSHCITPTAPQGKPDLEEVQLWYAVGLGGVYYGSKEQCEKEVRKAFPDEGAHRRYARVFYTTFYREV